MTKNPYSDPRREDRLPCKITNDLKGMRELSAKFWQEGYDAAKEETVLTAYLQMSPESNVFNNKEVVK